MIKTKTELREYIAQDGLAWGRTKLTAKLFGDELWKFQLAMRRLDYYKNRKGKSTFTLPFYILYKLRYHRLSLKLGFSIPCDVCGKGLCLPHYGYIVIHGNVRIGENCRILDGVNIGATNGSTKAPQIGNNVFIGSGAKIIGDITICDGVSIGANAVVIQSITESETTWAGIPAKKISDKDSKSNLNPALFN